MGLLGRVKSAAKKVGGAVKHAASDVGNAVHSAAESRVGKGFSFLGRTWAEVYGGTVVIAAEAAKEGIEHRSLKAAGETVKQKVTERVDIAREVFSGDYKALGRRIGAVASKETGGSPDEQRRMAAVGEALGGMYGTGSAMFTAGKSIYETTKAGGSVNITPDQGLSMLRAAPGPVGKYANTASQGVDAAKALGEGEMGLFSNLESMAKGKVSSYAAALGDKATGVLDAKSVQASAFVPKAALGLDQRIDNATRTTVGSLASRLTAGFTKAGTPISGAPIPTKPRSIIDDILSIFGL